MATLAKCGARGGRRRRPKHGEALCLAVSDALVRRGPAHQLPVGRPPSAGVGTVSSAPVLQSFAGGRLIADRYGQASPRVLALHGWQRSRRDFAPFFAAARVPGLAVDLPGFGESPPPPAAWGSPQYAAALDDVLDAMDASVVVVGHSLGGRIALQLAVRRPERVAGLLLTGVPLFRANTSSSTPALAYRVVRALARAGVAPPSALEAARRHYGSHDYRNALGVMREVLVTVVNETYDTPIATCQCPVELVWGAEDRVCPVAVAERAGDAFARAHVAVIDGIDHFLPLRAPEALVEALRRLEGRLA